MNGSSYKFLPVNPIDVNFSATSTVKHRRCSQQSSQTDNYDEEADYGSPYGQHAELKRSTNSLQTRIYNFLERPSGISCFLYHFIVFVIVIGCLAYSSILTVYIEQSYTILFWIESILFILFLIEYLVRVWSSGCRSKYRGRHGRLLFMRKVMCIVDLCVIIGYVVLLCVGLRTIEFSIQLVRYVRILQILRFLHVDRRLTSWRLLGSVVYDHRYELIATLYFCFIFLIVVAYLIWLVEKDETKLPGDDMFHSFADTLWWAIVTMVC
jgi:potassium voltage-gated channel KQT-like subfamily member 1